jgi:hypothetical protein
MRAIAVDVTQGLVYEGDSPYGRGVLPMPTLLIATILSDPKDSEQILQTEDLAHAKLIFREDSFDAITRVRRGRFYAAISSSQPHQWYVEPHPALPPADRLAAPQAKFSIHLHGFAACPQARLLEFNRSSTVALGPRSAYTLWRVVARERIVTGEDLVTLKSLGSLGVIPELNRSAVPADAFQQVTRHLDALVDAAHASGASSVIDRARDAAQWCLGVWWAQQENDVKLRLEDLGTLARKIEERRPAVSSWLAKIIARLHSRAKPNEQERYSTRPPTEDDGQFVVAAIGMLLREIGWAES